LTQLVSSVTSVRVLFLTFVLFFFLLIWII
jgi:hypothetical protein